MTKASLSSGYAIEHYTLIGVRIATELGTDAEPEIVRVSQFTEGPFQQSYILKCEGGSVLIDPMRPKPREGEQPFLDRIGDCQGIVLTTALHERNVYWFRERLDAPIYCPEQGVGQLDGTIDHAYSEGDELPGGLSSFWVGEEERGDAPLLWKSPSGSRILFAGDAINGQTEPGGFNGAVEAFWMESGRIRLRLDGDVGKEEFEGRFLNLRDVSFDLILNGHNPKPIENGQSALRKVLDEGDIDSPEGFTCTYLVCDL